MTAENLTAQLAAQVMNWRVGPDRFTMGQRRWMPRGHFRPTERIEDAFRLLEHAKPQEYAMGMNNTGTFWVEVRIDGVIGQARGSSKALVISIAVGRAFGIEMDSLD